MFFNINNIQAAGEILCLFNKWRLSLINKSLRSLKYSILVEKQLIVFYFNTFFLGIILMKLEIECSLR